MAGYGLIGYPLTHSFSPAYFAEKFRRDGIDATYTTFPLVDINELAMLLLQHPELKGLNVTIPYKEAIIPLLDDVDPSAAKIGAVNCITINNGLKTGYNTDVIGFRQSLQPILQPHHTHALILGTGGSSRAVAYVLEELGITYKKVSRKDKEGVLSFRSLTADMISQYPLIINTTPIGMHPDVDAFPPIPYDGITPHHLLYDLVYNPPLTRFLAMGQKQGATVKNGQEMLKLQAEASWEIWRGVCGNIVQAKI